MNNNNNHSEAFILLSDGTIFHGKGCGSTGTALGELCFTTSMTGYQEVFTDPSYYGQLLLLTNVHVGNYGVIGLESESDSPKVNGVIVRQFSETHSRSKADGSLKDFFVDNNLVAIQGLDTRAIVRYIRDKGAMNAIICNNSISIEEATKQLNKLPSMEGMELASKVSTDKPYFKGNEDSLYRVAVIDHGVKKNILTNLINHNCYLKVFNSKTTFKEVEKWNPDAFFISNGPGDPSSMPEAVNFIKEVLDTDKPLFGICLGHQLLAKAMDIPTYKMHNGHRGINHPVKNLKTGKSEITTQNHGFGIDMKAVELNNRIKVTHVNLNDGTIEGIEVLNKSAFSVQYHPEANPGPHDSNYLFNDFIKLIERSKTHE